MTITTNHPPTTHLPPIKKITSCTPQDLLECLHYLRRIFNPPVRGSRRRNHDRIAISAPSLADEWRTDSFERSYAIRWLTRLISTSGLGDILIHEAASLLAVCSGTAGAGVIHRDFVFSSAVHVKLTDVPLDNHEFQSVGAQTWGGACVMAEAIVDNPTSFGLRRDVAGLRILELGAGTGLVSLAVAKLYQHWDTPASIVATDFYPTVLANLQSNITANFPLDCNLTAYFLDWATFAQAEDVDSVLREPFDIVFGADIVYDVQHAYWIKSCLQKLLRKSSDATFHLTIPLRAVYTTESGTIDSVFAPVPGNVGIFSKECIICDAGTGNETETVEYAYYKIGWVRGI